MAYPTIISTNAAFPVFNIKTLVSAVNDMCTVSKQRRTLSRLTTQQLTDIGITPQQRATECNRRLWQIGQTI